MGDVARECEQRRQRRERGREWEDAMTFCDYLKVARAGDNFRGDFISDTFMSGEMDEGLRQRNPQTIDDPLGYLRCERRACREALQGARAAWRSYRAWRKRQRAA